MADLSLNSVPLGSIVRPGAVAAAPLAELALPQNERRLAQDSLVLGRPVRVSTAPSSYPPGAGLTLTQAGVRIESSRGQAAGAGFEGRVARESLEALKRAGGVSYAYVSRFNGNREVNVWASPGFDPTKPYKVMMYNRGIDGDNAGALEHNTHMAETLRELNAEGRNVLLVLPKSPKPMDNWFAGSENAGAMMHEALGNFQSATGGMLTGQRQETWLMAHSGGGKSVANILSQPDSPHFDKILLADSTYGDWAGRAADALQRHPGTQLAVVVSAHNAGRAASQLGNRGVHVGRMPGSGPTEGHNNVPAYMATHFLSNQANLTFSSYVPGSGWRPSSQRVAHRTGLAPYSE